jgi:RHS repeat-associated protein
MKAVSRIVSLLVLFTSLFAVAGTFAAEKITYFHWDATGSPVAATDEQGNVVWRKTYKPYGEETQTPPTSTESRSFTGHVLDANTGLLYAGARYYDPTIGRFMAVDPAPFTEKNIHSFNRYAYGNNNPYKYNDPDGRCAMSATGSAAGAQAALDDCLAGRGEFGADFLDYALIGMDIAVPVGGGAKLGGKLLDGAGAATKSTATDAASKGLGNPFRGNTPEQVDDMFKSKGFEPRGPDPVSGKGGYVNPQTGRSYHIDPKPQTYRSGTEHPHVDVNRPRGYDGTLDKRKFPLGDKLHE